MNRYFGQLPSKMPYLKSLLKCWIKGGRFIGTIFLRKYAPVLPSNTLSNSYPLFFNLPFILTDLRL